MLAGTLRVVMGLPHAATTDLFVIKSHRVKKQQLSVVSQDTLALLKNPRCLCLFGFFFNEWLIWKGLPAGASQTCPSPGCWGAPGGGGGGGGGRTSPCGSRAPPAPQPRGSLPSPRTFLGGGHEAPGVVEGEQAAAARPRTWRRGRPPAPGASPLS